MGKRFVGDLSGRWCRRAEEGREASLGGGRGRMIRRRRALTALWRDVIVRGPRDSAIVGFAVAWKSFLRRQWCTSSSVNRGIETAAPASIHLRTSCRGRFLLGGQRNGGLAVPILFARDLIRMTLASCRASSGTAPEPPDTG